jgi:chromosome segregation ATPase
MQQADGGDGGASEVQMEARRNLKRLRCLIVPLGVVLVLAASSTVDAAVSEKVERACEQVEDASETMSGLRKERAKLLAWLKKLRKMAASLQKREAGPARDYQLRTVMGEAREMASRLSKLDSRLESIRKEGKRLVARLQQLSRQLGPAGRKRVAKCVRAAKGLVPARSRRSGRLTKVRLDPNDGPSEIRRKADLLADSADKIGKRLKKLRRSIAHIQRQVSLRKAVGRADRKDELWSSDSRKRVAVKVDRSPSVQGVVSRGEGDDGPQNTGDPDTQESFDGNGTLTGSESSVPGAGSEASGGSAGATVSVQTVWRTTLQAIRDLTDPATAAEISKAFASSDLETRLKALERAKKILKKNIKKLRRASRAFRRRAKAIESRHRSKSGEGKRAPRK